jgi:hypothetical protein
MSARGRISVTVRSAAGALIVGALIVDALSASACPPATPADFAMFPSTLLPPIQPESLLGADPTACPGGTNESPCGAHLVYVPAPNNPEQQARQSQLYLFLPGTRSEPDKYTHLLSMAAYTGYKTIGLSYDNTTRLETACANSCGCYGPARREVVLGGKLSPVVTVRKGDTITYRLYRLLKHLEATYPAEGWGAFLGRDNQNGTPEFEDFDWDAIVISGHSQGAGHTMVITKKDAVDGILLVDGGNDDCTSGGRDYAQWHDVPNIPAPRRAFFHDRGTSFKLPPSFTAMDFGTTSELLDTVWPMGSKVATTDQTPPQGCTEHGSMAYDRCMPDAVAAGAVAASAADAYLFPFYVAWMCEVGN